MRTISNRDAMLPFPGPMLRLLALLFALLPGFAFAQEGGPPKVGFIRLVNAIGHGTGNAKLLIDGKDMYAKGYKLGQKTGGVGFKVGKKKVTVTKEGLEEGSTDFTVEDGETVSLIAFGEKIPAEGDKPERWVIKILRLKQRAVESRYRLTVVSVSQQPETLFETKFQGAEKPESSSVKRLMTTTVELGSAGGDVVVKLRNSDKVLSTFRPDDPGNYVLLLYDDDKGELQALYFYDPKFVVAG